MLISESWVNATEGYRIGDSGEYEPFTDNIAKLFRSLQKEYGRCVSNMYCDTPEAMSDTGKAPAIGWVFQKIDHYEDTGEPYLKETWVSLHDAPTTVTKTPHYHEV